MGRVKEDRTEGCPECGAPHPRCSAHNVRGGPCGHQPPKGQRVCRLHGGAAPQARAAAETRRVEEQARKALRQVWARGEDVAVADPLTELARLAGEVVAFKDYLRGQVEGLNGVLTYWQEKDYLDGDGDVEWTKAAEDVRAVVAAYERAQERAAKVLGNIVKLDLAGRLLALRTAQAAELEQVIRLGLGDVDMPHELRRAAEAAISARLLEASGEHPVVRGELAG